MAGPITHIILALKILPLLGTHIDKQEFLVGTSFPDIRYMAHLSREQTHIEPVSWSAVLNEPSSFRAGMLFHNLVDKLRIQYFEEDFFAAHKPENYTKTYELLYPLLLKTVEDQMLYRAIPVHQWQIVKNAFETLYDEELLLCADKEVVKKWHRILQGYFSAEPSLYTVENFLSQVGNLRLSMASEEFNASFLWQSLIENQSFANGIQSFYNSFESYLEPTTAEHEEAILEKALVYV